MKFYSTHEPKSDKKRCYDCKHLYYLGVNSLCQSGAANMHHGTTRPLAKNCPFWEPQPSSFGLNWYQKILFHLKYTFTTNYFDRG